MSSKIIAGNWKMNLTSAEVTPLISNLEEYISKVNEANVIVFPPFIYLSQVKSLQKNVALGAQNCSTHESGAFTGEVSAKMIKDIGASHVLIGHSERRAMFQESNSTLSNKINQALNHGLKIIFCVGESLEEREAENEQGVISNQLSILKSIKIEPSNLIIAYEPVWAIGTGKTANTTQISEMHDFIHSYCQDQLGMNTKVLYGGSCKPSNAKEILAIESVNGVLVGGASLKSEDFSSIIQAGLNK